MHVPFHLNRRAESERASALLLFSHDSRELLAICAELAYDPLPDFYASADGFLIVVDTPTSRSFPNSLRLRREVEFLFVPVDADLAPQLQSDEAEALVRDRGLVILPGGRCLGFDRNSPLETTQLLRVEPVRREGWEPMPQPRQLTDAIRSIRLELPFDDVESALGPGGEGIGSEDPRPAAAGAGKTAANQARMNLGQMLAALGNALGIGKLKRAGQRMIEQAVDAVPRLGEKVFGNQEAALRDLLKKFREGKIDDALKRAIPKADAASYRGRADAGARLPMHNLRYSLANILGGGGGGGPASIWYGHDDVVADLFREYRMAAEDASRRGDFRRAAFIYGKLLSEWREAADVLARGGLHHDSAIVYRDKIGDHLKAAEQFEAAGEFDESLRVYDRLGDHERAGDLLRRMGDEDRAIERFIQAAESMKHGRGLLAAGEFVLRKTHRSELAESYFSAGWALRNVSLQLGHAVPCGLHLARIYSTREKPEEFLSLLGEGEAFFAPAGKEVAAGQFFNQIVQLSTRPEWAPHHDELRDRCLIALASKLREHAATDKKPGTVVSTLLGENRVWEAPVVRDAVVALKALQKKPPHADRRERSLSMLQLRASNVTSARVAPSSGDVFAGFESGEIAGFRAAETRVFVVGQCRGPISALATDMQGDLVVAEYESDGEVWLQSFYRAGAADFRPGSSRQLSTDQPTGLAPLIIGHVLVRSGPDSEDLSLYRGADLLPVHTCDPDNEGTWPIDLPLPEQLPGCPGAAVLVFEKGGVHAAWFEVGKKVKFHLIEGKNVDWLPSQPPEVTLHKPRLAWGHDGPGIVEIAGLNESNALYWLRLSLGARQNEKLKLLATGCKEGYRTASLMKNSRVVGITRDNRLIWLRAAADRLDQWAPSVRLPSTSPAAACFYTRPTEEILVFLGNGYLVRVPVPS